MTTGLSVSDVVNVEVILSPPAAKYRNFGAFLIVGSSPAIDTTERVRQYSSMVGVAQDFSTTSPEFLAAQLFFSQSPTPAILYIGRWAKSATSGVLHGASFSSAQALSMLQTLTGVSTGAMAITIDGQARTASGMNFSGATNLNAIAAIIGTALSSWATVTWDAARGRFDITSKSTGATSMVGYATAPGSGVDIGTTIGLTQAAGASIPVDGVPSETSVAAYQALASATADWYGVMFADSSLNAAAHLALASINEAQIPARLYCVTTSESGALDSTAITDTAAVLKGANLRHAVVQFSRSSPYAVASLFARAATVDFTANNSTITLKFKTEPGVTAETLTETQAQALRGKNANVFVNYNNNTAIIQEGTTSDGSYIDEVHGLDWLQNKVQNDLYNLLYTSPTKIPQTEAGLHMLVATAENACVAGVNNGLMAPGLWTGPTIGQLRNGDTLNKGYYVYAPQMSSQSDADRAARKSPTIQVAAKLAGAIHTVDCIINVNR